jgi:hypothetical protein
VAYCSRLPPFMETRPVASVDQSNPSLEKIGVNAQDLLK